jgi:hypothetical protein
VQTLRTMDAPAGGVAERLGPSQMIQRTEFTRLLVDALQCLGHTALASALETESVRAPPRGAPLTAAPSQLLTGCLRPCVLRRA